MPPTREGYLHFCVCTHTIADHGGSMDHKHPDWVKKKRGCNLCNCIRFTNIK